MLLTHARSLRNQARLAITLAWVGGYTNVISVLGIGTATSHVSGTATLLGRSIVEGNSATVAHALLLIFSFLGGALLAAAAEQLAGYMHWRSVYVLPIAIEFFLLAGFAIGLEIHNHEAPQALASLYWISICAAAAMGAQNATISRISGGVVRTTHVTGVLTDLGIDGMRWLVSIASIARERGTKSLRQELWLALKLPAGQRLLLLISIFGSFVMGAAIGAFTFQLIPGWAMFLPAAFLLWIILMDIATPIADMEVLLQEHLEQILPAGSAANLPTGIAVYRLGHRQGYEDRAHRAPDLGRWAESLPETARVVVLDLGVDGLIDPASLIDLRDAKRVLRARGTRLVLSGADQAQLRVLRELGVLEQIPLENQCESLAPALQRARHLIADTPTSSA